MFSSCCSGRRKKGSSNVNSRQPRIPFTPFQQATLEQEFQTNQYLTTQVVVWFLFSFILLYLTLFTIGGIYQYFRQMSEIFNSRYFLLFVSNSPFCPTFFVRYILVFEMFGFQCIFLFSFSRSCPVYSSSPKIASEYGFRIEGLEIERISIQDVRRVIRPNHRLWLFVDYCTTTTATTV